MEEKLFANLYSKLQFFLYKEVKHVIIKLFGLMTLFATVVRNQ